MLAQGLGSQSNPASTVLRQIFWSPE